MLRPLLFLLVLVTSVLAGCHYEYEHPDDWATLDCNQTCDSHYYEQQSPVQIWTWRSDESLRPLPFKGYKAFNSVLFFNGHTVVLTVPASYTGYIGTYKLVEIHFHTPGEHFQHGVGPITEIHLVHQERVSKKLAVVALRANNGCAEAVELPWVNEILRVSDRLNVGVHNSTNPLNVSLPSLQDSWEFLEKKNKHGYWTYHGSLTTPPCSENVQWFVLEAVARVTFEQLETLMSIEGRNSRPVQRNLTDVAYFQPVKEPNTGLALVVVVSLVAAILSSSFGFLYWRHIREQRALRI